MTVSYSDMSEAEIEDFAGALRFGILGTNRVNGPPQLTPVWYLYDNQRIYISVFVDSAKYKNLCRDPRATLCIAGECPDARAVIFSGSVELFPAAARHGSNDMIWRLTRRYYESDKEAQAYLELEGDSGAGALVVLTPDKVLAQDYN